MSAFRRFICSTLLCLPMTFNLWIQATISSADVLPTAIEPGTGQSSSTEHAPAVQALPSVLPGAAPNFQRDSVKSVSPFAAVRSPLFTKALFRWLGRLEPNQGGIIWLSVLVTILIAFDFRNLISWRNADVLLLLIPSFLLIDLIHLGGGGYVSDPTQKSLLGIVFLGIFLVSVALLIRALVGAFIRGLPWVPNLSRSVLIGMLIILLASNTLLTLSRNPDDAGAFTNIGAYRMLQTGKFPYGDPGLRGGAAATYGPVLYMAHMPFQLGMSLFNSNAGPMSDSAADRLAGGKPRTGFPPVLATKLTLLFFHFLGVVGLVMIGWRMSGPTVGLGIACLYVGSAYVQGLGGETHSITGLTFISHIAPAATTILAFAALSTPFLAGVLLATAVGVNFYPAFFFPLWFGYYFWRGKQWQKFAAGFIAVCLVIGISVLLLTQSSETEGVFEVVYESTVGHQEAKHAYGSSSFSFWGTHGNLAAFWQKEIIPGWYLLKPSFLVFAVFVAASFFMVRGRTKAQLAFLTAALAIAIQLWKSHAGGTYVEWYYPFLLIGFFARQESDPVGSLSRLEVNGRSIGMAKW